MVNPAASAARFSSLSGSSEVGCEPRRQATADLPVTLTRRHGDLTGSARGWLLWATAQAGPGALEGASSSSFKFRVGGPAAMRRGDSELRLPTVTAWARVLSSTVTVPGPPGRQVGQRKRALTVLRAPLRPGHGTGHTAEAPVGQSSSSGPCVAGTSASRTTSRCPSYLAAAVMVPVMPGNVLRYT